MYAACREINFYTEYLARARAREHSVSFQASRSFLPAHITDDPDSIRELSTIRGAAARSIDRSINRHGRMLKSATTAEAFGTR